MDILYDNMARLCQEYARKGMLLVVTDAFRKSRITTVQQCFLLPRCVTFKNIIFTVVQMQRHFRCCRGAASSPLNAVQTQELRKAPKWRPNPSTVMDNGRRRGGRETKGRCGSVDGRRGTASVANCAIGSVRSHPS